MNLFFVVWSLNTAMFILGDEGDWLYSDCQFKCKFLLEAKKYFK